MTSAGASFGDQNTELFKVIKGDVVVDLQGAAGLPRTAKLIEQPVQNVVTEAVTQTDYQADSRSKFSRVKLPEELLIIVAINKQ